MHWYLPSKLHCDELMNEDTNIMQNYIIINNKKQTKEISNELLI